MIISEFHKQMHHQYQNQSPLFWRYNRSNEFDLLLDKGLSLDVFEIKASETVLTDNFKGLAKFEAISNLPIVIKGLIYAGTSNQNRLQGKLISWKDFADF
jgi:hypothetical protein